MTKILSFEVLHVEITQKLQNLESSILLAIFDRFSIFTNFFVIFEKKFWNTSFEKLKSHSKRMLKVKLIINLKGAYYRFDLRSK